MDEQKPVSLRDRIRAELQEWVQFNASADPLNPQAMNHLEDKIYDLIAAGADFSEVDEAVERTPAQAWAFLLDAEPDLRMAQLDGLLESSRRGAYCWTRDHQAEIEDLRNQLAQIPEPERRRARMVYEAEQFVHRCGLALTDDQWATVRASIDTEVYR